MTREVMTNMVYWHMHAVKAVCILQRKLWIYNRKLQDYLIFLPFNWNQPEQKNNCILISKNSRHYKPRASDKQQHVNWTVYYE